MTKTLLHNKPSHHSNHHNQQHHHHHHNPNQQSQPQIQPQIQQPPWPTTSMTPPQMSMSTQNSMSIAPCQSLQWTKIEKGENKTKSGERGWDERREREREAEIWEKRLWGKRDVGPQRGIKYIKLILQLVRMWMYQFTVVGLQIFLDIATWLKHVFMILVVKIAIGGILHSQC